MKYLFIWPRTGFNPAEINWIILQDGWRQVADKTSYLGQNIKHRYSSKVSAGITGDKTFYLGQNIKHRFSSIVQGYKGIRHVII